MVRSAVRGAKKASASGVAIRIVDWPAPLGTGPGKVNVLARVPFAS
jgi:hypothetical protein